MSHRLFKPALTVFVSALLLLVFMKPAHALTINVSGNGSGSDTEVNTTVSSTTSVEQNNTANVSNNIDANANTGNNTANGNTGGDVTINTGNANTEVSVNSNINQSKVDANGGSVAVNNQGSVDTDVSVSGNGDNSNNDINLNLNRLIQVVSNNLTNLSNSVNATSNTGDNDASGNTGGDVNITTGNAKTSVVINNNLNSNEAQVSCGCGKPDDPGEPGTPSEPVNPTTIAAAPTSSPSVKDGDVLAVSVLPATGTGSNSNWAMFLAMILIALGFYLRKKIEDWYYAYYHV